jgi:6-phosphofructokinase 1
MTMRKIAILTGGGDCPGLNAVIRAAVVRAHQLGAEMMGIRGGWRGLLEGDTEKLTLQRVEDILDLGGTILGTTRVNPFQEKAGPERVEAAFKAWHLDGLIAVGGDGTLSLARKLYERGLPVVGVPKTIDNDISGTEVTFGFDTAVAIATEAIDRLRTTAEAHERVMVVEVMGRTVGWIAMYAGLAGGADVILVPERPVNLERLAQAVHVRRAQGMVSSVIVVSEGVRVQESPDEEPHLVLSNSAPDAFGRPRMGGAGQFIAEKVEEMTGIETRMTVLGYVQRGGTPTAHDRVLSQRFGLAAVDLVAEGRFGQMVALKGGDIVDVSLEEATGDLKYVDDEWLRTMGMLTTMA